MLSRLAPRIATAGVVLFWIGTVVAGVLAPGYDPTRDFISSLAGRGSSVAPLGIATLAVLGLAHLVAAVALRDAVAVPLAMAGAAGLTIAAFRVGCPLDAAGCGTPPNTVPDAVATVHGVAVGGYEVAAVVAMLVVAWTCRRTAPVVAVFSVVAAVASVVLLGNAVGVNAGLWQRGWLVVNTAWLVVAVLQPTMAPRLPGAPRRGTPWQRSVQP